MEKKEWKHFYLQTNLIQYQTDKSFLIKIPKTETKFWISKKLVKIFGKNEYGAKVIYFDDMTIKLYEMGAKESYTSLSGAELANEFEMFADLEYDYKKKAYPRHEIPILKAIETGIDDELRDDN